MGWQYLTEIGWLHLTRMGWLLLTVMGWLLLTVTGWLHLTVIGLTVYDCNGLTAPDCNGLTVSDCNGLTAPHGNGMTVSDCNGLTTSDCNGETYYFLILGIHTSSLLNLIVYRRCFIPHSVSLWNVLGDIVFDGVGLAGFKSRVNASLLAWAALFFFVFHYFLFLFLPFIGWLWGGWSLRTHWMTAFSPSLAMITLINNYNNNN